jgi:hypothetical protein
MSFLERITRITRIGPSVRSATASLLIESNQFMKENVKFVVVLPSKNRYIRSSCMGIQKCILGLERWMGAVKQDMLLILVRIITQVTF